MKKNFNHTKKCFKCDTEKSINEFYRHPGTKDGYLNKCKECTKKDTIENYRKNIKHYSDYDKNRHRNNIDRLFKNKYSGMKTRVLGKNTHKSSVEGKKLLSHKDFLIWCYERDNMIMFLRLYEKWKNGKYARKLCPSIDRINNDKGYILGNLQWITQQQNSIKHSK